MNDRDTIDFSGLNQVTTLADFTDKAIQVAADIVLTLLFGNTAHWLPTAVPTLSPFPSGPTPTVCTKPSALRAS